MSLHFGSPQDPTAAFSVFVYCRVSCLIEMEEHLIRLRNVFYRLSPGSY